VRTGNAVLGALFTAGIANIIWLSIYGFYLPASIRVGLSTPQALTTLTVVTVALLINRAMMAGATVHGPIAWGQISVRGMVALFGLAATFTWVMGLMGFIRSSGRLSWHITEIMPDLSPWAYTPTLSFAAKMVTLNMAVFWLAVLFLFWLSGRDRPSLSVAGLIPRREATALPADPREVQLS
jgi:cytochrome bd ubiquinol oxidase subunit I